MQKRERGERERETGPSRVVLCSLPANTAHNSTLQQWRDGGRETRQTERRQWTLVLVHRGEESRTVNTPTEKLESNTVRVHRTYSCGQIYCTLALLTNVYIYIYISEYHLFQGYIGDTISLSVLSQGAEEPCLNQFRMGWNASAKKYNLKFSTASPTSFPLSKFVHFIGLDYLAMCTEQKCKKQTRYSLNVFT